MRIGRKSGTGARIRNPNGNGVTVLSAIATVGWRRELYGAIFCAGRVRALDIA
jgi:hypothetical protein